MPAGEQRVRVRFTYDLNGILEVDTVVVHTGQTKNLVIEGHPGRLTRAQVEAARQAMAHLNSSTRRAAKRDSTRAGRRAPRRAHGNRSRAARSSDRRIPGGARIPGG